MPNFYMVALEEFLKKRVQMGFRRETDIVAGDRQRILDRAAQLRFAFEHRKAS